ncbi:hypothetical protein MA16_Dca011520 [Dendrobium catenatum]|uniref:Uncharacterized protein n=1 Tax=Dendrobium catenatum TaxID=906689 RepID=A0A2I0VFM4_9ASPA|nr:hypothetical protein MA16_Dca011520 [Dendrobium catenatum]
MGSIYQYISLLIVIFFLTSSQPCIILQKESFSAETSAGDSAATKVATMREEIYRPLLLNLLPRGNFPRSGPSKGTNEYNN